MQNIFYKNHVCQNIRNLQKTNLIFHPKNTEFLLPQSTFKFDSLITTLPLILRDQ